MHLPPELWTTVRHAMPIPCVDLLVEDEDRRVLLIERRTFPVGWWFPGGRVLFGESRIDAVQRKLRQECGLEAVEIDEWWTYDLIFRGEVPADATPHAITTVFRVDVLSGPVRLDEHSSRFAWRTAAEWLTEVEHPMLRQGLHQAARQ